LAKYLKGMVYKTVNIPVLMFGVEAWTMTRKVEGLQKLECCGGYLEPHRMIERNEVIRKTLGVACITDKIQEARLRWYGHVMRREDENSMKRIMMAEVNRCCRRSYGRHDTARHEVSLIKERTY